MVYAIKYHDNNQDYRFDNINEILVLINLQSFSCWSNNLTELPSSINQLIHLQTFYCFNNNLTELPSSINQLIHLQSFYCRNNKLTELPSSIIHLRNITTFDKSNNPLELTQQQINYFTWIQNRTRTTSHSYYNDNQNVHNSGFPCRL
jgi:hypothetical protein